MIHSTFDNTIVINREFRLFILDKNNVQYMALLLTEIS